MVGTAYLDDAIWPRYAAAYNSIPVLSSSYPTEAQIMAVNPDFILVERVIGEQAPPPPRRPAAPP